MHAAKSAKTIALQEKTRNSRNSGLVQRVAMGRAHFASVIAAERRLFTGLPVGGAWARTGGIPSPGRERDGKEVVLRSPAAVEPSAVAGCWVPRL